MKLVKFVLIFQAIITLIIGIVFLFQVFNIQYNFEEGLKDEYIEQDLMIKEQLVRYNEFKQRFFNASYIIVVVSLIELIIIWRLFDRNEN